MKDQHDQRKKPATDWESVVDRAIREAQERGAFDNLRGMGKPLKWDDEHVPPEWRMAHRILKNAGYAPAWIEDAKWIRAERKAVRQLLERFVVWYAEEVESLAGQAGPAVAEALAFLQEARDRRIRVYRERVIALNKRIDNFNLIVPVVQLQWPRIQIEIEVDRFCAQLEAIAARVLGTMGEEDEAYDSRGT